MDDEEQQQSDEEEETLMYDGGKKAKIFVIDYGEHMFEDEEWRFRLALKAVRDQINKLCCMGDPNELCSVIFVNTANSNNIRKLHRIFTDRELGLIDAEYVKKLDLIIKSKNIKEMLKPTFGDSGGCDWAELFLLCQLTFKYPKNRVFRKKVITIITTDKEQIGQKMQESCKKRIRLNSEFICTEIKVLLIEKEIEENETTEFWRQLDPYFSRFSTFEDYNKHIFFFKDYIRRPTISLPFELGYDMKFAVGIYYLIKPQVKPTAKHLDSQTNETVECKTHYIPKEDEQTEEDMDITEEENDLDDKMLEYFDNKYFEGEINFSINIGGVNVILNREEKENLKRFDQPGIKVIGFKPLHLLKPSHRMGNAKFIYPLDKAISGSSDIYRVLLNRCLERNLFIVVRFTQRSNTAPQICALIPQSLGEGNEENNSLSRHIYEGFLLIELPFTEEARDLRSAGCYKSQPISFINSSEDIKKQQITVMEQFVDKLTTNFEPDQFFNPKLQKHYKTVENVALDLNFKNFAEEAEKLDKLQPYFKSEENVKSVAVEIAKLNELFSGRLNLISEEEPIIFTKPKRGRKKKDN